MIKRKEAEPSASGHAALKTSSAESDCERDAQGNDCKKIAILGIVRETKPINHLIKRHSFNHKLTLGNRSKYKERCHIADTMDRFTNDATFFYNTARILR